MADVVNRGASAGDQSADSVYVGFGKINTEFAKDHGIHKIHAATAKDEPVDADEVGYSDSADSFKHKKVSWTNIKAFLKAYFDSIYSTVNSQKEVVSIIAETASFILALIHAGAYIKANSSSAIVITVPPNADVAIPINTVITISQTGTGAVSVTAGSGVTLNYFKGLKVAGRYAALQLVKVDVNTWDVIGGIA